MPYIDKKSAIDALKAIRYGLWEIDIPSPTVPEYVEHHEQIKNMLEITDGWIKRLEEQPTADVMEVKHGKWVGIDDDPCETFECDRCGFVLDDWIQGALYNYCPNCGADMREETDHAQLD